MMMMMYVKMFVLKDYVRLNVVDVWKKKDHVISNGVLITALIVLTVPVEMVMNCLVDFARQLLLMYVMMKPVWLVHVIMTVYLVLTDLVKKILKTIVLKVVPNA